MARRRETAAKRRKMSDKCTKVLLIEDNPGDVRLIQEMLAQSTQDGYQLECADRLSKGLECLGMRGIDLVLLDLGLPDSQGLDTFDKVHAQAPAVPIVLLTGLDDEIFALQAVRQGAQDYLVKGDVNSTLLCRAVRYAVERKRSEEELRESELRYRLLADNATDIIWTSSIDLTLTYVSPSITRTLGYSTEEVIGKTFEGLLTPASFEVATKVLAEELAIESMVQKDLLRSRILELELNCEDGSTIWAEVIITFLRDPDDRAVGILGTARDITERKRAEEALRKSEDKLQQLFKSATDGIFALDLNGAYTELNERMLVMLGFSSKDEILGKNALEFVAPRDINMVMVDMQRTLEQGTVMCLEYTSLRADFSEFPVELTVAALRDASGNPVGFVGILRDITERRKIEQAKRDFVSLVSHQLKTPVVGIKLGIENMLQGLTGDLTTKQKQYLQEMHEICSRNYRLVSDLLNISRIERGVLPVDIEPIKLREIVDLSLQDYRGSIKKKGLALNLEETDEGVVVLADVDKMVEALSNVINNAVKFTDKGSITIKITREGKYGIVEVMDTGTGMPDDVLNSLFTKEKALSDAPTSGGGAGLGLYIAKSFMEVQKGDITATSVVGKGSTFVLRIPREQHG
ncbi:MAG: PAS domain S-box protein [Dehalococcoidia bacterium]|nr:PAS domain S-box protein [Dehalococcoidia bacterium]